MYKKTGKYRRAGWDTFMKVEDLSHDLRNFDTCSIVKSVLKYINQQRTISDLVAAQIIVLDENGKMLQKWDANEEVPEIFSSFFCAFNFINSPNKFTPP